MAEQTRTPQDATGGGWLDIRADGLPVKAWIAIGVAIAVLVVGFGAWWTYGLDRGMRPGMDGMDAAGVPRFPPVAGYHDGERVFFVHTEASDPKVADLLTDMMDSPVVVVPELAETPESARGPVYVFTNGVTPDGPTGPLGFQPDVFDTAPGDPGYTPLREVRLVTWRDGTEPRTLTSAGQIERARASADIQIKASGVVVNMPFLQWPQGER